MKLTTGEVVFPQKPVTVPADSFFFWPINMELGAGVKLIYATAQPVCQVGNTFYFAETPGVRAEFVFEAQTVKGKATFSAVKTGRKPAFTVKTKAGVEV